MAYARCCSRCSGDRVHFGRCREDFPVTANNTAKMADKLSHASEFLSQAKRLLREAEELARNDVGNDIRQYMTENMRDLSGAVYLLQKATIVHRVSLDAISDARATK